MRIELPAIIAGYFAADRVRDPQAVADCFTPDACVVDEGKHHIGHAAIRLWMADAATQYTYTVEPFAIEQDGGRTQVRCHLSGNFPGSPVDLRYIFRLDGDRIAGLEITP